MDEGKKTSTRTHMHTHISLPNVESEGVAWWWADETQRQKGDGAADERRRASEEEGTRVEEKTYERTETAARNGPGDRERRGTKKKKREKREKRKKKKERYACACDASEKNARGTRENKNDYVPRATDVHTCAA